MNIQVRVITAQANRALAQQRAQIAALQKQMAMANRGSAGFGAAGLAGLNKFGNRLQWFGRQLSYNFSLPLLAAGALATKWALDQERGLTRISKLYGDATVAPQVLKNELTALGGAFEALSNHYGVQQKEVLDIAAAWAAAGSSGLALAKQTDLTMRTMILGEIGATKATEALIAIQAQYGLTVDELTNVMEDLNVVENMTGVSTAGLIDAFSRAAGTARSAGVDHQHLAAMLSAIVPAAGTAAQAGNALKTIISRLQSPTKEAVQVLGLMGIKTSDLSWKSTDAAGKLKIISDRYTEMNKAATKATGGTKAMISAQLGIVSSVLASRWQINKFDVLMRGVADTNGYYTKTLEALKDRTYAHAQAQKELNTVLASSPQRVKQVGVILQNSMIDVIQPLIPLILYLGQVLARFGQWLQNLDPGTQKLIIAFGIFFALLGPLTSRIGVLIQLIAWLGLAFLDLGKAAVAGIAAMGRLLVFPFTFIAGGIASITMATLGMILSARQALIVATYSGIIGRAWLALQPVLATVALNWAALKLVVVSTVQTMVASVVANLRAMAIGVLVQLQTLAGQILVFGLGPVLTSLLAPYRAATLAIGPTLAAFGARVYVLLVMPILAAAAAVPGFLARYAARVGAGLTVVSAAFNRGLAAVQTFLYVWGGQLFDIVRNAMLRAAAFVTMLPSAMASALQTMWFLLTGYGALTAEIGHLWAALNARLVAITTAMGSALTAAWAAVQGLFATITAAGGAAWTMIWAAVNTRIVAVFVATQVFLRRAWLQTLAFLAGGGVIRMAGMVVTAFASMGTGIMTVLRFIGPAIVTLLTSPIGLAIAAVVILLYAFRDQVGQIIQNTIDYFGNLPTGVVAAFKPVTDFIVGGVHLLQTAFYSLPGAVQNAMLMVVQVVANAAKQVYDLFSYLNPFAHHSPSLVENVTNGMGVVASTFKNTARSVAGDIKGAYGAIKSFGRATAGLRGEMDTLKRAEDRKQVVKFAPGAVDEYDKLVGSLKRLKAQEDSVSASMDKQQGVVDKLQGWYDKANEKLSDMNRVLGRLKDAQQLASDALDKAKDKLTEYGNTPLKGMGAMEDQIFANKHAQDLLNKSLLDMGDAADVDKLKDKLAKLQGEIEGIRGRQGDLRAAGAGSDVLGFYDQQVAALEGQQGGLGASAKAAQDMQDQLAKLQKEGQALDLQKAIDFEGPQRDIQKLLDTTKEMSFDDLTRSIKETQAAIGGSDGLQAKYDAATASVVAQEKEVAKQQDTVDRIQGKLDTEQAKLDSIKKTYEDITKAIQDSEKALSDVASAADAVDQARKAKKKSKKGDGSEFLSPGAQNFIDAKGGSFADVGGTGSIGREGGTGDQSKQIEQWTKDLANSTAAGIGEFSMWQPFKDMWNKTVDWFSANVGPILAPMGPALSKTFSSIFGGLTNPFPAWDLGGKFQSVVDAVKPIFSSIASTFAGVWKLLGPEVMQFLGTLRDIGVDAFNKLLPKIAGFRDIIGPLVGALQNLSVVLKPILEIFGGVLLLGIKTLASVLNDTLGPAFDMIIGTIGAALDIIHGAILVVLGVISGDWGAAWDGIKLMFSGTWDAIIAILKGVPSVIFGIIKGLVTGIWDFFKWIWDELVGHSIVPDMVNGIIGWIQKLTEPIRKVWDGIKDIFNTTWGWIRDTWSALWGGVKDKILSPISSALGYIGGTGDGTLVGDVQKGFNKIWTWVSETWSSTWGGVKGKVLSPINSAIGYVGGTGDDSFIGDIKKGFNNIWSWVSETWTLSWNKLKGIITKPINDAIDVLTDAKDGVFLKLQNAFSAAVEAIGTIWDGLKEKTKAPIRFMVNTVLNKGLIAAFNKIVGFFGGKGIDDIELPKGFAKGGVVPGASRTGYDNTLAPVSSGEAVMRQEWVRAVGPNFVDQQNRLARQGGTRAVKNSLGGYGGLGNWASKIGKGAKDLAHGAKNAVGKVWDAVSNPYEWISNQASGIVSDMMARIPSGGFGQLVAGMPKAAMQLMLGKAKEMGDNSWTKPVKGAAPGMPFNGYPGHTGQDFPTPIGTSVFAAMRGKIIDSQNIGDRSYGQWLKIQHANGFQTLYAHLSARLKGLGDVVGKGEEIAKSGNQGNSTGPHLHFEIRKDGTPVDPMPILRQAKVFDQGGVLPPGGVGLNLGSKPEAVLTPVQWKTLSAIANGSGMATLQSVAVRTVSVDTLAVSSATIPTARTLQARQDAQAGTTLAPATTNVTNITINGNLQFPNIKNGEDADEFIRNLKSLGD